MENVVGGSKIGIFLGVGLMLLVCFMAGTCHLLLIDLANKTGCRTYRELAVYTFGPRAGRYMDSIIIFYTTGTLIAYPIIIGRLNLTFFFFFHS